MEYSNHLKASHQSRPAALGGAIAHAMRSSLTTGEPVSLQAIGVDTTYTAIKAVIIASQNLAKEGVELLMAVRYAQTQIEGIEKTAIRFEFRSQKVKLPALQLAPDALTDCG